jgi:hypothetical protein
MKKQAAPAGAPGALDHAGVEPRNGYLPPRARVTRMTRDTPRFWAAAPPVPALTDPSGESVTNRAVIRLAFDGERLHADVRVRELNPVLRPDWGPGSNRFWEQDHIEIRFLPDSRHDLNQVQLIVAADGRVWDNRGAWAKPGVVRSVGKRLRGGWAVRLAVPYEALGVAPPVSGDRWRGIVGHTRWGGGGLDIACSGATELGYPQADRFGEWLFGEPLESVFLESVGEGGLVVVNRSRTPVRGVLRLAMERGGRTAQSETRNQRLAPGRTRIPFSPSAVFPLFDRYSFGWKGEGELESDWGAVSLRGALPQLRRAAGAQARPGLLFDAEGIAAIRAKMKREPFLSERGRFSVPPGDLTGTGLPGPDEPVSMAITKSCMNWFRVAKETMLRDGEGKRKPAAAYLWERQSEAAKAAWRGIVKTVQPTHGDLEVLIAELNGLLARRDFYNAAAFADVHLPAEGRELLARGVEALRDDEVFRLNRIVLQSTVECIGAFRMDLVMKPGELWGRWLVTGDDRLIATATRAVRAALRLTIMDHQIHLHEGMAAGSLALAYDSFYPRLGRADRVVWRQLLMRFVALYLETARRRAWTVTTIANANPVGNGGCGLAALALLRERPREAGEALGFARRYIRIWLDYCSGPSSGNTEGAQYWQYGMENFLRFARALERVTGSDDGLLAHPAVANAMNMIRVGLCNDGALHGVNDTVPMPIGGAIGWFLAGRTGDRFGLWYGDHALRWLRARQAAGRPVAYDISLTDMLLNRPAVAPARRQPPLPEAFMLPDIQYGILRSGTAFDCRWTAGLKGSRPPYTHHNQRDTGAVFIELRGERLLIDPGYYKPEPEDHSLPLIDGKGPVQPAGWTGTITACGKRGPLRWLSVDATAAYGGAAERVVRHLVLAGDEGVVLLDDIVAAGKVTARYTCGGVTRPRGAQGVDISGTKARLRMELLGRAEARPVLEPERSLHDSHWGYHFADCLLFPVTAEYAADVKSPLVTVFLDETDGKKGACKVERKDDRLTVRLPGGARVCFAFEGGVWQLR